MKAQEKLRTNAIVLATTAGHTRVDTLGAGAPEKESLEFLRPPYGLPFSFLKPSRV